MVFKTNVLLLNSLTLNCFSSSVWPAPARPGMGLEFRGAPEVDVKGTEWCEPVENPWDSFLQWQQQLWWQELLWVPRAPYGLWHLQLLLCSPKRVLQLLLGQGVSKENKIQFVNYQSCTSWAMAVKNYLLYYLFSAILIILTKVSLSSVITNILSCRKKCLL